MVRPNGPLIFKSEHLITLQTNDETIISKEKEFALCRCGLSKTKPFCDGTHKKESIEMTQSFTDRHSEKMLDPDEELIVTVKENAMYSVNGSMTIFSRDGESKTTRNKAALCRCRFSENKPFCDGKHKKCGFTA